MMALIKPQISSQELGEKLKRLRDKKEFLSRQKLVEMAALLKQIKSLEAQRRDVLQIEAKLAAEAQATKALATCKELVPEIHAAALNLAKALQKFEQAAKDARPGEITLNRSVSRKFLPVVLSSVQGDRLYLTNCLEQVPLGCDPSKSRNLQLIIQSGGVAVGTK
jgi:uncharacterized secreted protein with C-terminal beta-propeller domain